MLEHSLKAHQKDYQPNLLNTNSYLSFLKHVPKPLLRANKIVIYARIIPDLVSFLLYNNIIFVESKKQWLLISVFTILSGTAGWRSTRIPCYIPHGIQADVICQVAGCHGFSFNTAGPQAGYRQCAGCFNLVFNALNMH